MQFNFFNNKKKRTAITNIDNSPRPSAGGFVVE